MKAEISQQENVKNYGYDPLSIAQKHVALRNGGFEFYDVEQSICVCNHTNFDHLDYNDCCLSKQPCICERFLDKKSEIVLVHDKQGKLPHKESLQKQKEDGQLNNYIQTLAKI